MLIAVLIGFVVSFLWGSMGSGLKPATVGYLATMVPLALFIYFMSLLAGVAGSGGYTVTYSWVPSLGVNLSFRVDGLALLFALLISGIGTLVFAYTTAYMKGYPNLHRFYAYLSLFMGAMLGLVLSDNLISLFIFWELTSISSFFLIGYKNEDAASRRSAMIALAITSLGGLFLLAGAIVLGSVAGTYSIQGILQSGIRVSEHGSYVLLLICFCGAAFTKSAQFPFHFWLPGAMKAPTPVSTYLHSATMVKAGVYLLLRMTPVLNGHEYWHGTLIVVGGFTMLYAAFHALFRTDLKGILAYSTISALGIMVFLIGVGTQTALLAAAVFILVHALYKASLFLVAGTIEHVSGTRDVTKLAGLGRVLAPVALAGLLAAASNAGIPPTVGFIGKDLIYEATMLSENASLWLTTAAVATNIMLLAAGMFVGVKPFAGDIPDSLGHVSAPGVRFWAPPLLLGILGLLFGLMPGLIEQSLVMPVLQSLGISTAGIYIKLWHGFNTVLMLSGITVAAGLLLYFKLKPTKGRENAMAKFNNLAPEKWATVTAAFLHKMAFWFTSVFQSGHLRHYVRIIILFLVALLSIQLFAHLPASISLDSILDLTFYEVTILAIMLLAIYFTVFTRSRLGAVAAMGVVGYSICLLFVFYSAPDLAMTQFTIDTLTVILFVLVLYKLPKYLNYADRWMRLRDGIVALSFGTVITLIALSVVSVPAEKEVGTYYASNAYVLAKGKNIVNVILVDFRGVDTMVEITVLVIAALGVFGLMKLRMKEK